MATGRRSDPIRNGIRETATRPITDSPTCSPATSSTARATWTSSPSPSIPSTTPKCARLNRLTLAAVRDWSGNGTARLTIKKKSGETKYFDTHGGVRNATPDNYLRRMTDEDVTAKFKRAATDRKVATTQQAEALAQWWDLSKVKDIAIPMKTLATFGQPEKL